MATETNNYFTSRRRALKVAVGALCHEVGFGAADDSVLETLTEALQSCRFTSQVCPTCNDSQHFTEVFSPCFRQLLHFLEPVPL